MQSFCENFGGDLMRSIRISPQGAGKSMTKDARGEGGGVGFSVMI